ncbi:hypothetical protein [Streptomyces sp. RLB3-6]|uniref:hypothetical protein n=1 Tax=Streptomyces sp. RLB3-6 TaxID=2594457 RepID=UPI001162A61D|nr:hypothetical protein [Streptomyces sp. RLB3-6]QDN84378.1 hypothetical protein FNV61_00175 [Streptomyces sp. RLB3-6]
MKVTLAMEYAEITFDAPAPDVPVSPGVSFDLPLDGYVVHAEVEEVTITYPVSRIVLTSPAPKGRSFRDVAADLARTDYASNVTAQDLDDDGDD